MSDTFTPPTAASFAPVGISTGRIDPAAWPLPKAASDKLIALHQRAHDLFVQIPPFEDIMELTNAKLAHDRRILDLTRPRGDGGYNLDSSAPQVRYEQEQLDRVLAQRTRLQGLKETRTPRWHAASQLERAVTDWLKSGIPRNCELHIVEDATPAKLLLKNETAAAAVERFRGQFSDLAGKLEQVRRAPWPSALAIQEATKQIKAMATPPDCKGIIDQLAPIGFAPMMLSSTVHGAERPALAFSETINSAGLFAWLFERELIAKVTAEIKQAAKDGQALDEKQRATQEATLLEQMMACERAECSLIWAAQSRDETIIDFRSGTAPAALLGVRAVVAAPRPAPSGTSPEHGYDIVGVRR